MCAFIVNPPIRDDADYYRRDDHAVTQILDGASKLVVGLRRSGKTSFLYRVQRAARARGLSCEYLELADCGAAEAEALAAAPPAVLLLDEAEVWHDWDPAVLQQFVKAIRRAGAAVVTCAPEFVLEPDRGGDAVRPFVARLERHILGPLSDDEARELLTQSKRPPGPLPEAAVAELLASPVRLPILLQALGAERVDGIDVGVSLSGFGRRLMSGLTEPARKVLVDAAHRRPVADGKEARLLISTGALRRAADGQIGIESELLAELILAAGQPEVAAVPAPRPQPWERHARIAHLSDLHFGNQAIDRPEVQAQRLTEALERGDRVPDFFAITGDLSWSGHRSELRDAEAFLELIVAWLGRQRGWDDLECRRRVIIVPGNHEAAWALSGGIRAPGGAPTEDEVEHWVRYSLGPFANFVNRFYRRSAFWDLDAPCIAASFEAPSIAFVSMSTAHYVTQHTPDARFGEHVRARALELLAREDVQRARFRLGVWHHNLRPFQSQPGAILDVDVAVRDFLRAEPGLDLALHGHVHQGELDVYLPRGFGRVLTYSAVGSFGVIAHHRPGDDVRGRVHNEFAVVELQTSGAERRVVSEFYELKPDTNSQWRWERARTSEPRQL